MFKAIYLAWWYFEYKFLKRQKPLQSVIFLHDYCNLNCKHCCIEKNKNMKTFEKIVEELHYCYNLGSRFVDLEGGEPFLWKDNEKNIENIVLEAKKIGFFQVTITTNAQQSFNSSADMIWVSLDGINHYHDLIRGEGTFEKAIENINATDFKNLNLNMVINSLNYEAVEDTIKFAKNHPKINKIALNFHTPFFKTENLMLNFQKREEIIDLIIKLKKQNYPIMNSISGLKLMKYNNFEKKCQVTNFILPDGTKLKECTGKTLGLCENCGFAMAGEMACLFKFNLETILAGLKVRF